MVSGMRPVREQGGDKLWEPAVYKSREMCYEESRMAVSIKCPPGPRMAGGGRCHGNLPIASLGAMGGDGWNGCVPLC